MGSRLEIAIRKFLFACTGTIHPLAKGGAFVAGLRKEELTDGPDLAIGHFDRGSAAVPVPQELLDLASLFPYRWKSVGLCPAVY